MASSSAAQFLQSTNKSNWTFRHNEHDDLKVQLGPTELAAISLYISVVGVLGLIGNILVVAAFYRYRSLRTSTNTFILHLGLCNLILAAMDLGFSLPSTASQRWLFGLNACRFYGLTYHFFCFVSLNTLAIISLDRYWVITKPAIGIKITIQRAVLCILISYAYTIIFSTPLFLQWKNFHEETFYTGCYLTFQGPTLETLLYSVIHGLFLFLVPFGIMIFCYGSIFKSVKRKGRYGVRLRSMKGNNKWSFTIQRIPHWRTARMIIVVIFVFLACWLPYVIVSTAMTLGLKPKISTLTLEITLLVAKSGVIYNPFIYAALNLRFRTAFFEMLNCDRFFDRSRWGIKSRVLTMSTGDSSGQHVSRTSASNCTSSRALVTRSASFIRACDACSPSAEHENRNGGEQQGTPRTRAQSMYCEGRWQQPSRYGEEGFDLVGGDQRDTHLTLPGSGYSRSAAPQGSDTCAVGCPNRRLNSNNVKKNELDSLSDSDKSEQNLVQILRISTRVAGAVTIGEPAVDNNYNCPCKEIWKARTGSKSKKKRLSANVKEESFSCTCGPNVNPLGTPRERNRKEHGKSNNCNKNDLHYGGIGNGKHWSEDFEICPSCSKQVINDRFKKENKKSTAGRETRGSRYSYHLTGRKEHRSSQEMGYCTCQKTEGHRFGLRDSILNKKLKNRRTSESVHTASTVATTNESFWRRPSLVLANNVYPISFAPSD